MAERDMWCAVVHQAIIDATYEGNDPTLKVERDHAVAWLTRPSKDFAEVCSLAGLDPEAVRERATAKLARKAA